MKFKVVTVFNRLDGFSNGLFVVRNENTFAREFLNNFNQQNDKLAEKNMPTNRLSDFQVRCVGEFDDETCFLTGFKNIIDIPFNVDVE